MSQQFSSKNEIFEKVQKGEISAEEGFKLIKQLEEASKDDSVESRDIGSIGMLNVEHLILEKIQDELIYALSEILKVDESKVIPEKDIRDYGLDSIRLVNLNNYINEAFNLEVAPFVFFENPTIELLAKYLGNEYKNHFIELYRDSLDLSEYEETSQVQDQEAGKDTEEIAIQQPQQENGEFFGRVKFTEQPIWVLNAEKELNEEKFLNFWQDLKERKLPSISRSNVSKEHLHSLINDGYSFMHLMVKNSLGKVMEVYSAGKGKPVLMVTGLGMTAPICLHQIKEWSANYQVLVVSMPGVGLSDGYNDLSLDGLAGLVMETVNELGIEWPLHLVGISWGSLVTSTIAHKYADKIATMTMVGPTTNRSTSEEPSYLMKEKLKADFNNMSGGSEYYDLFLKGECIEPISFSQYMRYFTKDTPSPHTNYHLLTEINTPTLIVAGKHDTIIDHKEFELIYSRLPDADMVEMDEAGHVPSVTNYKEFNKIVSEFIEAKTV